MTNVVVGSVVVVLIVAVVVVIAVAVQNSTYPFRQTI
jgi:hypothetical protein